MFDLLLRMSYDDNMETNDEKLYVAYGIAWNSEEEEYEFTDFLTWNGEPLEFETYAQFLEFMASLSEEQKNALGEWRIEHRITEEYISIAYGLFNDVSILSLQAARNEAETENA